MNVTNLAIALSEDIVTMNIRFAGTDKTYTYLCEKELAEFFKVGDLAICWSPKSGDGIRCILGDVTAVHTSSKVDIDSQIRYNWVLARCDKTAKELNAIVEEQEESIADPRREAVMQSYIKSLHLLANSLDSNLKRVLDN